MRNQTGERFQQMNVAARSKARHVILCAGSLYHNCIACVELL